MSENSKIKYPSNYRTIAESNSKIPSNTNSFTPEQPESQKKRTSAHSPNSMTTTQSRPLHSCKCGMIYPSSRSPVSSTTYNQRMDSDSQKKYNAGLCKCSESNETDLVPPEREGTCVASTMHSGGDTPTKNSELVLPPPTTCVESEYCTAATMYFGGDSPSIQSSTHNSESCYSKLAQTQNDIVRSLKSKIGNCAAATMCLGGYSPQNSESIYLPKPSTTHATSQTSKYACETTTAEAMCGIKPITTNYTYPSAHANVSIDPHFTGSSQITRSSPGIYDVTSSSPVPVVCESEYEEEFFSIRSSSDNECQSTCQTERSAYRSVMDYKTSKTNVDLPLSVTRQRVLLQLLEDAVHLINDGPASASVFATSNVVKPVQNGEECLGESNEDKPKGISSGLQDTASSNACSQTCCSESPEPAALQIPMPSLPCNIFITPNMACSPGQPFCLMPLPMSTPMPLAMPMPMPFAMPCPCGGLNYPENIQQQKKISPIESATEEPTSNKGEYREDDILVSGPTSQEYDEYVCDGEENYCPFGCEKQEKCDCSMCMKYKTQSEDALAEKREELQEQQNYTADDEQSLTEEAPSDFVEEAPNDMIEEPHREVENIHMEIQHYALEEEYEYDDYEMQKLQKSAKNKERKERRYSGECDIEECDDEEGCDCCHCRAMRDNRNNDCSTIATAQQALQQDPSAEMKFFIDSVILEMEAMQQVRCRKRYEKDCTSNHTSNQTSLHSQKSFPVTITDVTDLGTSSLYVKWVVHDCSGIGGYEIFLDGYMTNRYFNCNHEAAVICDVDVTTAHKISLVAKPKSSDIKDLYLGRKSLLGLMGKSCDCPKASSTWVPSIYLYDPTNRQAGLVCSKSSF